MSKETKELSMEEIKERLELLETLVKAQNICLGIILEKFEKYDMMDTKIDELDWDV
jgi:hypothetical protein